MQRYEELLKLAEADLRASELLLNSFNDELMQNNAAYHSQQALEKLMKALNEANGAPATVTHSITVLWKDLEELGVEFPEWVKELDDEITAWSTTIRYNSNFKSDHDTIDDINRKIREWMNSL